MECDLNKSAIFTVTADNVKIDYPITQTILLCCPNWKKKIEKEKNIAIELIENISIDGIQDFFEGLSKNGKIYITNQNCHTIHYLGEKCGNSKIVNDAKKVILENSSTPYHERLRSLIQENENNNHRIDQSIEEEDVAKHYNELLNYPDILKNTPIAQHCRIVDIALNYYKDQFNYRKFISFVIDLLENENDRKYNSLFRSLQLNDFDSTEINRLCKCKNYDENLICHKVSNLNSKILECEEKITKQEDNSKIQFEQINNILTNLKKAIEDIANQHKEQIDLLNEIKKQMMEANDGNNSQLTQLISNQKDSLNEIQKQMMEANDGNNSQLTQLISNQKDLLNEIKKQNKETSDEIKQQNRKDIEKSIECLKNEIKNQINSIPNNLNIDENMIAFIAETIKENLNNISNIPKCPGCNAPIIKNGGCDHMTCLNCGQHFCNLCGSKWEGHSVNSEECKKKQEYQIFIKSLKGNLYQIETRLTEKTSELRQKIVNKINYNSSNLILMYGRKQIEDGKTVSDYGICRGATIFAVLRVPGG